jgi:RNA polymerase sigma factor (sigma-70 family)
MIELLREIRKKDKNAIMVLYNRYGIKLYGFAVTKWNLDEDEAWEIVYQTLYKIIEVVDRYKFEEEKKFAGFLFTVFVNNLRNYYNKKKKVPIETAELNDNYSEPVIEEGNNDTPVSSVHMNYLQDELQQLEEWKRILLLMRAQDFSYEEIAAFINKPADQLKVYYMRLKKQITEKINERINQNK